MKELFPIGTVVALKNAEKPMMIIGLLQKRSDGKFFDYLGVPFPEGYVMEEAVFLFNHEDIDDVKFIGCVSAQSQQLHQYITENYEDIIKGIEKGNKDEQVQS